MKLLILDRDGTLTTPASGGEFRQHPRDLKLLPRVKEKIQEGVKDGWVMAIASNQGGCEAINPQTGQPYQTIEWAIEEMFHTFDLLPEIGLAFFCPDFKGERCWMLDAADNSAIELTDHRLKGQFRKPNPGMLQVAILCDLWKPWDEVLYIGDRPEDMEAAKAAGVKFIWEKDWRVGWTRAIGF